MWKLNRQFYSSIRLTSMLYVVVTLHLISSSTCDALEPRSISNFSVKTHRGLDWSLADTSDSSVVVVAFLGTECPLAKLYGPRLQQLQDEFADRGVAFVGVNSNTQDSITEITGYVARHEIRFPMLKDADHAIADLFHAERTPEVFVLDADRQVRYRGRIDDQYLVGKSRNKVRRRDLAIAITELLSGGAVSVPETEAIGCHVGRRSQVEPHGSVTWSNQIVRIFNQRCVECHRSGQVAPFALDTYDDVIGWEDTILEVIADNRMPPWLANPKYGHFENDARLSDHEKELICKWVNNGMPKGDQSQLPEPPKFADGWRMEAPDQVIKIRDEPFRVPAEGVVDYQYFTVDPGWTEDKYVCAAEARPDNAAVVHHIIAYIIPPGAKDDRERREMLVGYAPGNPPHILDEGTAIHVKAGTKLVFEMHYTPNGAEEDDLSYIGVKFMEKKDVKRLLRGGGAWNTKFEIPPRASNYTVMAEQEIRQDSMLLHMTPHMHLRGKSFRYEAVFPGGESEILLDVPHYDFNWQLTYKLAEPRLLPRGTTIRCTAAFDNSERNLANPDPGQPVRWGDQSWEEMMIGFYSLVPVDER